MEKFLQIFNLQRLNYDVTGNMNRPITSKGIESVIKNLTTNQSPWPDGFSGILPYIKRRMNTNPSQTLPKHRRKELSETNFMRPALLP